MVLLLYIYVCILTPIGAIKIGSVQVGRPAASDANEKRTRCIDLSWYPAHRIFHSKVPWIDYGKDCIDLCDDSSSRATPKSQPCGGLWWVDWGKPRKRTGYRTSYWCYNPCLQCTGPSPALKKAVRPAAHDHAAAAQPRNLWVIKPWMKFNNVGPILTVPESAICKERFFGPTVDFPLLLPKMSKCGSDLHRLRQKFFDWRRFYQYPNQKDRRISKNQNTSQLAPASAPVVDDPSLPSLLQAQTQKQRPSSFGTGSFTRRCHFWFSPFKGWYITKITPLLHFVEALPHDVSCIFTTKRASGLLSTL